MLRIELINEIQRIGFEYDGIVLNPGGYTHTSVALGDAIAAIKTKVIEVHISNVHAREDFRKLSHISGKSVGSIFGLGLKGYELAVKWFVDNADNNIIAVNPHGKDPKTIFQNQQPYHFLL